MGKGRGGGPSRGSPNLVDKRILTDNYRVGYKFKDPANKLIDIDATFYLTQFKADELRLDDNAGANGAAGQSC